MVKKRKLAGGASTPSAQQPKVKTEHKEEPVEEAEPSAPVKQEPVEADEDNNTTNDDTAIAQGNCQICSCFFKNFSFYENAIEKMLILISV